MVFWCHRRRGEGACEAHKAQDGPRQPGAPPLASPPAQRACCGPGLLLRQRAAVRGACGRRHSAGSLISRRSADSAAAADRDERPTGVLFGTSQPTRCDLPASATALFSRGWTGQHCPRTCWGCRHRKSSTLYLMGQTSIMQCIA